METLIYQYFEFLGIVANSPAGKKQFVGAEAGTFLSELVKMLLSYLMLTNEQVRWLNRCVLKLKIELTLSNQAET